MFDRNIDAGVCPQLRHFYIAPRCQAVTYWLSIIYNYLLCYQTFLTNFRALYLTQFLTDFRQILDSKSDDQA